MLAYSPVFGSADGDTFGDEIVIFNTVHDVVGKYVVLIVFGLMVSSSKLYGNLLLLYFV